MHEARQEGGRLLLVLGATEGILQLPEDLRLALHHGLQARGETEEVTDRRLVMLSDEDPLVPAGAYPLEVIEAADQPLLMLTCDGLVAVVVDLEAIAGREDEPPEYVARPPPLVDEIARLLGREGELLTARERGGLVVDTD